MVLSFRMIYYIAIDNGNKCIDPIIFSSYGEPSFRAFNLANSAFSLKKLKFLIDI